MEVKYESFLKHGKQRRLDRRHLPRGGVDPMELILSIQAILFEIDCAIFAQIYMNCFVS